MREIKAVKIVKGDSGTLEERLMNAINTMQSNGLEVKIEFSADDTSYYSTLVIGSESTFSPNLLKIITEQHKVIENIANPNMKNWSDYKEIVGENASFQTFLQNIANDYLYKG